MRRALLLVVAMAALAGLAAPYAQQPGTAEALVAVLRRDGLVLPFAAFDGRRWVSPWPAAMRNQELPIGFDDIPAAWWGAPGPQRTMTLWTDGVRRSEVAIERPATIPLLCSARVMLRSAYTAAEPAPPPFVQPYPKDGLLVSGGHRVEPVPRIAPGSAEWNAAPVVIRSAFDAAEEAAAAAYSDWRHPVAREVRQATPIRIEALYRVPMDEAGWAAYFVEAVREYAARPEDEGCGLVTFVSGWLRVGPEGRVDADLSGRVTYCDRRRVAYFLPLGVMTLDGRRYWIVQTAGYDREWYSVIRPTPRRIEVDVDYPAAQCLPPA